MRDVIVGFLGFRSASPFAWAPFAPALEAGGSAKLPSDCECKEEAVEAEGTGEAMGFGVAPWGLLLTGAAMFVIIIVFGGEDIGTGT